MIKHVTSEIKYFHKEWKERGVIILNCVFLNTLLLVKLQRSFVVLNDDVADLMLM